METLTLQPAEPDAGKRVDAWLAGQMDVSLNIIAIFAEFLGNFLIQPVCILVIPYFFI